MVDTYLHALQVVLSVAYANLDFSVQHPGHQLFVPSRSFTVHVRKTRERNGNAICVSVCVVICVVVCVCTCACARSCVSACARARVCVCV